MLSFGEPRLDRQRGFYSFEHKNYRIELLLPCGRLAVLHGDETPYSREFYQIKWWRIQAWRSLRSLKSEREREAEMSFLRPRLSGVVSGELLDQLVD